jgi:hypothetical protein
MEDALKFVGGVAIALGAVAWLIRSLIQHVLSKDVETFKNQLRTQSDLELERLRHSLKLVAAEHEKRTHLLQERRAQVIAELYSKLMDFLGAAESFASLVEWSGEPSKDEKAAKLGDVAAGFHGYFIRHRIYFTPELCVKVDALFKEVHADMLSYRVWMAHAKDRDGGRAAERMHDAWTKAWETMSNKAPPLTRAIEQEFRSLLGVNVPPV